MDNCCIWCISCDSTGGKNIMADYLYNAPENVTDSVGMMEWINNSATLNGDGILFPGIIVTVFIIMFVKMLTNPQATPSKAFGASVFIAMILSVFGRVINLVSTGFMSIWIGLTALAVLWMFIDNKP